MEMLSKYAVICHFQGIYIVAIVLLRLYIAS